MESSPKGRDDWGNVFAQRDRLSLALAFSLSSAWKGKPKIWVEVAILETLNVPW